MKCNQRNWVTARGSQDARVVGGCNDLHHITKFINVKMKNNDW